MGKFSIIVVLAFSTVLLAVGPSLHRQANRSYENYQSYVTTSTAHNIAVSAANIAANRFFLDSNWTLGCTNVSYDNGTYSVEVEHLGASRRRITAIAHLQNSMLLGNLQSIYDTVEVVLQPSSFAKFAVYLNTMGSVSWFTGDTVWGPCHVEGTMNLLGTPVFYGKVTTNNGTNPATLPSGSTIPKFYGGYQTGVSVPLPADLSQFQNTAAMGGWVLSPPSIPAGTYEVSMVFNADGTVSYKEFKGGIQLSDNIVSLSAVAPNGAILIQNGNLRVKGTFHGQATIGATGNSGAGNVFIDGDIRYADDVTHNPSSTDFLGLIADQNVTVPLPSGYPSTPPPNDVMIQASIFARAGSFNAQLSPSMGRRGAVTVIGSVTANSIGAFSVGSGGSILYGYENHFLFDERLLSTAPPAYPKTRLFEIISWKE